MKNPMSANHQSDPANRARLRWRSRRGLVENDLFIERFFKHYGAQLKASQARAMTMLMNLSDNDLLDLLLVRKEPEGEIATDDVRAVLKLLRERA